MPRYDAASDMGGYVNFAPSARAQGRSVEVGGGNRGYASLCSAFAGGVGVHTLVSWDDGESAVGRIVGLPEDRIEVVNGVLRINGQAWDERYLAQE